MIEHLHDREKTLEPFGWKGREAEWVALVCLHSGVFTRTQWCHYFNDPHRVASTRFVRTLLDRGHAVEYALPNHPGGARVCRIFHKPLYRALGIENVRHRREAEDSLLLRRLLSLDYILEHPELHWLPTEQEKVGYFDSLGIERTRIPRRIYQGAMRKQTRYFALKLPIAVDAKTATFAYIDPGKDTDTELRSWGEAHEWLWRALRGKGLTVQVIVIGADHDATMRSEKALKRWSNGAAGSSNNSSAGPSQADPEVKAEMQFIENALRKVDTAILAKYGGIKRASKRLIELRNLPKSKSAIGALIDSYETWVSPRLRILDSDL